MYSEDYERPHGQERNAEDVYSKPVRAGKRTYFFDVKTTNGNNDYYLTITESKRRQERDGSFTYDKHKIFLYKEDFEKFANALKETLNFIETGEYPEGYFDEPKGYEEPTDGEMKDDVDDWFNEMEKK